MGALMFTLIWGYALFALVHVQKSAAGISTSQLHQDIGVVEFAVESDTASAVVDFCKRYECSFLGKVLSLSTAFRYTTLAHIFSIHMHDDWVFSQYKSMLSQSQRSKLILIELFQYDDVKSAKYIYTILINIVITYFAPLKDTEICFSTCISCYRMKFAWRCFFLT